MTMIAPLHRNLQVEDLPSNLPGAELVREGIAALARGERTMEALLVALGAARLRDIGLNIPETAEGIAEPNLALYAAVRDAGGDHFDYNALCGRLSSFADAAEWLLREKFRERPPAAPADGAH